MNWNTLVTQVAPIRFGIRKFSVWVQRSIFKLIVFGVIFKERRQSIFLLWENFGKLNHCRGHFEVRERGKFVMVYFLIFYFFFLITNHTCCSLLCIITKVVSIYDKHKRGTNSWLRWFFLTWISTPQTASGFVMNKCRTFDSLRQSILIESFSCVSISMTNHLHRSDKA